MVEKRNRSFYQSVGWEVLRASFISEKALEEFDWSFNPSINHQQLLDLATSVWIDRHETCSMSVPAGCAKAISSRRSAGRLSLRLSRALNLDHQDALASSRRLGRWNLLATAQRLPPIRSLDPRRFQALPTAGSGTLRSLTGNR